MNARWHALAEHPRYTAARALARFGPVRHGVATARGVAMRRATAEFEQRQRDRLTTSAFPDVDVDAAIRELRVEGLSQRFTLPDADIAALRTYADEAIVYADREPDRGFRLAGRGAAEAALGKPILVAQYLNAQRDCPTVARLADDPALALVASKFLGSVPTLVGSSLWWTFPVDALEEDRDRHAHRFHRDVDDFAFVKFFFYVTPVEAGDGAHVCVTGSHLEPPTTALADRLRVRRYGDAEIAAAYPPERVLEICGPAGAGFAEDTYCVHKGLTPTRTSRLLLQFEFALFDYGVMHDRRDDVRILPR